MKRVILNIPVKNYRDIINNNQDLRSKFTPGQVVQGTLKYTAMNMLGGNYSRMAAAAQRSMEVPPLDEMFMHEILLNKHIGECIDNNQAIRICILLNELYLQRPEFTIDTQPIISEISDEDFNTLEHLLESYDGDNKQDYVNYWTTMVEELNKEEE